MIKTIPLQNQNSWQDCLADLITDPKELLKILNLKPEQLDLSMDVLREFPLRLPRSFANRMQQGNPRDPLLLQVLPQQQELVDYPGFVSDPLAEQQFNPMPGILHKYAGRVLLMPTTSCAIHCRYCFRRHFPYTENRPDKKQWLDSLQYIRADSSLTEVILSGGDPLAISDKHLEWLLEHLAAIPHIQRVRIHTRFPVVIPQRITQQLCDLFTRYRLRFVMVLHTNHAQELDDEVKAACKRLKEANVDLFNQSVLLKSINDNAETLADLSERLFTCGVIPYYLHMLDKVKGSGHFEVSMQAARSIMTKLRAELPGYLVPTLVKEEAASANKTPIL
ncbi:MAG: EF-P beta-lysylation protein EpmB [SAR86 cluster bacterium]|uniref:L-lysine 2,3-aminomutase n=1 Tax=SAR86 cluster bacterium TaxID=2030880 RepID=A0A2A5CHR0_9GAMM|nr:MAG: EF-P beta-lysylation protein EpmB [SAR86 cluster bacterium]